MSKTMRCGLLGLALAGAALAGAQTAEQAQAPAAPAAAAAPAASDAAAASTPAAAPPAKPLSIAQGNPQEGSSKAAVCTACHGVNGNSTNPEWPVIAGQSPTYIAGQLRLFRNGARVNPLMSPIAASLSEDDIVDLARFYAQQTPAGLEADPSYWKAGEALYRSGDAGRNVPACIACHGPVGAGNPASGFPALRAQHSVYTVKQLNDYAKNTRYQSMSNGASPSRHGEMMASIAKRLTPEDIRNLASYIQGLR